MRTLPQVTGPTENALRALLDRQLAHSSVPDYLAWVCMNLSTTAVSRADLEAQVVGATKCETRAATAAIDSLVDLHLLGADGQPTSQGQAELTATRQRVKAVTDQLVVGLSEDDLAQTIGVLDHIRDRAEAILNS